MTQKDSPGIQRAFEWETDCVDMAEKRLAAETTTELRGPSGLEAHGRPTAAELPEDKRRPSIVDTSAL